MMMKKLSIVTIALAALAATVWGAGSAQAGGACRGQPVTEETSTAAQMSGNCFGPTIVRIAPGETVTWTNYDPVAHTVSGVNASWGDYNEIAPGASVSHAFEAAGAYPYYCFLHPGMIGAVIVGSNGAADHLDVPAQSESSGLDSAAIAIAAGAAVAVAAGAGIAGYALGRRLRAR